MENRRKENVVKAALKMDTIDIRQTLEGETGQNIDNTIVAQTSGSSR